MIINLESCKHLSDNELVAKSLENLDYFSCLYQRYEPEMLRYIHRLGGINADEARDILQESFVKIWRNLNEFDASLRLSSWIYRIVHNETVSFIRKKKSFGKNNILDFELFRNILSEATEPHEDREELIMNTLGMLNDLPFKYKEVLLLKFFEKKSYDEISDILKIPEGTVAIRINRAKKMLRAMAENTIELP